jgi:hypothetical protein
MNPKLADKPRDQIDDKLDEASALSFPASDPPFFMGSMAIVGGRRSLAVLAPRIPAGAPAIRSDKKTRNHSAGAA